MPADASTGPDSRTGAAFEVAARGLALQVAQWDAFDRLALACGEDT